MFRLRFCQMVLLELNVETNYFQYYTQRYLS